MGSKHYISEYILWGKKISAIGQFRKELQANIWNCPVDLSVCHQSQQGDIWLTVGSSDVEQLQMS